MSSSNDKEELSYPYSDKENLIHKKCFISLKRLEDVDRNQPYTVFNGQLIGCNVAVVRPLIVKNFLSDHSKIKPCSVNVSPINWDPVIKLNRV